MWMVHLWCKYGSNSYLRYVLLYQIHLGRVSVAFNLEVTEREVKELSLWMIMRGHYRCIDEKSKDKDMSLWMEMSRQYSQELLEHPWKTKQKSLILSWPAKKHIPQGSVLAGIIHSQWFSQIFRGGQLDFNTVTYLKNCQWFPLVYDTF